MGFHLEPIAPLNSLVGCFLDGFAMIFLTMPVFVPVVAGLGFDLVWWGIVMVIVVEISLITPPIGLNVFVLKALAPDVPVQSSFKGIIPFLVVDVFRVVMLVAISTLLSRPQTPLIGVHRAAR